MFELPGLKLSGLPCYHSEKLREMNPETNIRGGKENWEE